MYEFKDFGNAARLAIKTVKPAFVFDGPSDNFIVAVGRDARDLIDNGHEPYSLAETARATR